MSSYEEALMPRSPAAAPVSTSTAPASNGSAPAASVAAIPPASAPATGVPADKPTKPLPAKKKRSGILIDVDYVIKNNQTRVRLQMKGKRFYYLYDRYEPYFYLGAPEASIPELMKVTALHRGMKIKPVRIEPVQRELEGRMHTVLKVYAQHPPEVPDLRAAFKDLRAWEYNIPFGRRYMMDQGLSPLTRLTYERQGRRMLTLLKKSPASPKLRTMSFDIETYNPVGAPRPMQDPCIMISYATGATATDGRVLTFKEIPNKSFVKSFADEKGMIEALGTAISECDAEVLAGYNSTGFDLPYLQARAQKTKAKLAMGRDGSSFTIRRRGIRDVAKIKGRIYVDLLPMLRFLSFIGAVKLSAFSLKTAYAELTGHKSATKEKMDRLDIYKMWDNPLELPELAEYSAGDARITWELAQLVLPLELEMAKVTCLPLNDVVGATASVLVESLLMHEAAARNAVVPNKPHDDEVKARQLAPIQGAYVRTPPPGIYENLIVFDFRGLYPSIITSHNIDPFMLNCTCCTKEESFVSPTGARFCKKRRGLIPEVLDKVIKQRSQLKDALKKLTPDSDEYRAMFARQQSLKILANSYYGYLAFARSRYYSRECAESVTAWGRHYITSTGEQAEKAGFRVLYQDTDSLFLLLEGKPKESAIDWVKTINTALPGDMELELEAFYPRGVFVSKKIAGEATARSSGANGGGDATGAKKKYALMDEKGRVKIRGFELVRRDWSVVARETQRRVLEAILKDGSKDKAVAIVKEVVAEIRAGQMPIEKFVIETALTKPLDKYAIQSPELSAAQKSNRRGKGEKLAQGSVVRYVITRSGSTDGEMATDSGTSKTNSKGVVKTTSAAPVRSKSSKASVSDKAELLDYAHDYDADYYIDHQIIPTVLKILKELGVSEDDLKLKGKQHGLDAFF